MKCLNCNKESGYKWFCNIDCELTYTENENTKNNLEYVANTLKEEN